MLTSENATSEHFSEAVWRRILAADREVTVEQDRPEAAAARGRQASMVEELRKVELVRDRLESLQQLVSSFPEGHDTRTLLENLHLDRALRAVEENIGALQDALLHPRGT